MRCIPLTAIWPLSVCGALYASAAPLTADRVYTHGVIFTAEASPPTAEAVAIGAGRIVYVGSDRGVRQFVGPKTVRVDLHGRFVMPGLVDGHMHPLMAGAMLMKCNLSYAALTVAELQSRVQDCLDQTKSMEPDGWLEVVNWFQESMRPPGVVTTHATLDVLKTQRPIIVHSSFGHTVLANARAMSLAKITAATPDPPGGKIWHDAASQPTGLFEDHEPPGRDELSRCNGATRRY
jgi:predicted amidohydrolase YtcJ